MLHSDVVRLPKSDARFEVLASIGQWPEFVVMEHLVGVGVTFLAFAPSFG